MTYTGFCDDETYWVVFSTTLLKVPDLHRNVVSLENRGSGQMVFADLTWRQVKELGSVTGIKLVCKTKAGLSWDIVF